jgi:Xaa-Pro dipeptidase
MEPVLAFPRRELLGRAQAVLTALREQTLDCAIITGPENIYYLTGNPISGPMALVLRPDERPVLVADEYDEHNIRTSSWIEDIRSHEVGQSWIDLIRSVLGSAKISRVGVDVKSSALSVGTYERLRAELPASATLLGLTAVEEQRLVKSPAEVDCIRAAARMASATMRAAVESARPGRTEDDVAAEIYRTAIAQGSEHLASQPYVKAGRRAWLTHGRWQGTPIEIGDVVMIELAGCVKRYHAAVMRSVVCGEPPTRVKSVADAVLASFDAALGVLRDGTPACDVDRVYRDVIARAGFGRYNRHALGYSIGVAFAPGWGEPEIFMLSPAEKRPVRAGMTFHMVPSVTIPGEVGHIACSGTVLVGESSAEVLTDVPREVFVVRA